ncbi:tetraketide alpha-pyrone reductase 1-like isoform X2 [Asparagus officinalis]|uniref:tetraketide alpha-pyrone reductase 1-like isoform X2 n=1 Tax=Asparagus officinalis TaxID=4686 RepID=UPI00098E56F1|nr:tetraketide alpha-pyrone reductase 1-like isoform X2 [Asparagus officinalis]
MDQKESASIKGKVCVTGAAGFFGSWLVKRLLESGYNVEGTVRDPGDYKKIGHLWELEGAKERLHLVRAELMDEGSFDDAIIGCEGVFHAAFPVLYPKSDPKAEVLDPAVEGTLNVLRSCKKSPLLKKVVLTSSTSAVARSSSDPKQPLDENSWSNAQECEKLKAWYPLGKLLAEQAAWRFAKENGDNEKFARRGRMGYVHIDDVASCHILVYENDNTEGRYLCTSTVLEVPELASILAKRYPWLPIPTSFPSYVQGPRFEYDTSKVQKLGIKFKGIEEMFDDAIQSLKEQGHLP